MRIQSKLFFIILGSCAMLVVVMVALVQWSVDRGMLKIVNHRQQQIHEQLVKRLAQSWQEQGSWDFLRENPGVFARLVREQVAAVLAGDAVTESPLPGPGVPSSRGSPDPMPDLIERISPTASEPMPGRGPGAWKGPPDPLSGHAGHPLLRRAGLAVLDADRQVVAGRYLPHRHSYELLPIRPLDTGEPIGWLAYVPPRQLTEVYDLALADELKTGVLYISLLSIVLSAALALPLAWLLLRRIRDLALATRRVAEGDYTQRVTVASSDELGQLGRDFNHLAASLQANEIARKRWIADISHELRTPLAIAAGELEAMIDGVRPATTANLLSARSEIAQLNRLVEDLYEMTNRDSGALQYRREHLDLAALVREQTSSFQSLCAERRLTLGADLPDAPVPVDADSDRLRQLLNNLLGNALKYTDPPGRIDVLLAVRNGPSHAVLTIDDTTPGVADEHLPHLFDHLYRVDSSRNRLTGGSGLGLTICRQIVEGHGGSIQAGRSELGGLRITVVLPLATEDRDPVSVRSSRSESAGPA